LGLRIGGGEGKTEEGPQRLIPDKIVGGDAQERGEKWTDGGTLFGANVINQFKRLLKKESNRGFGR